MHRPVKMLRRSDSAIENLSSEAFRIRRGSAFDACYRQTLGRADTNDTISYGRANIAFATVPTVETWHGGWLSRVVQEGRAQGGVAQEGEEKRAK